MRHIIQTLATVEFARPWLFLWLPVLLLVFTIIWWLGWHRRRVARRKWGAKQLLRTVSQPRSTAKELAILAGYLAGLSLLVVSAAGPELPRAPIHVIAKNLDVVEVFDVSRSLLVENYRPFMPPKDGLDPMSVPGPYGSALDYATLTAQREILPALNGNRVGIVTYSGGGWVQTYLNYDFDAVRWFLQNAVKIGSAPGGGSDQTEGLQTALDVLNRAEDQLPDRQKVIVWFTDGGFTGKQDAFAKLLPKVVGVRVIVVGIGPVEPTPIPEYTASGDAKGYIQVKGQTAYVNLDEKNLKGFADQLHGDYKQLIAGQPLGIDWAAQFAGERVIERKELVDQIPLAAGLLIISALLLRGVFRRQRTPARVRLS
jgi:von Willebrand factor type A domain